MAFWWGMGEGGAMRCAAGALLFLYRLVSQSDSKCAGMQASTYSNIYIYTQIYIYTVVSTEKYLPSSILAVANRKHKVHCQPKAWEILLETLLAAACKHYASHCPWTKLSEILTFAAAEANWLESAMLAQVSQLAKNSPNLWVYLSADGRLPGFFLSLQSMFLVNCFIRSSLKRDWLLVLR